MWKRVLILWLAALLLVAFAVVVWNVAPLLSLADAYFAVHAASMAPLK